MHQISTAPPSWSQSHPPSSPPHPPGALFLGSWGDSATSWPAPLPEDSTRSAMSAAASHFLKNLSPENTCFLSVINFSGETIIPIRIQTYLTTKPLKIVSSLFPSVSQLPHYISVPSSSKTRCKSCSCSPSLVFSGVFVFLPPVGSLTHTDQHVSLAPHWNGSYRGHRCPLLKSWSVLSPYLPQHPMATE